MTWNERIDLRHRQRKIFENSDNPRLRRAVLAGYDLHYDDSQGAWQDCVEEYETSDEVGYNQMARRLRHALHVANNGGRRWYPRRNVPGEYIQFGRLQYWNGTSWVNVPFGTPVITNNQIFWDHTLFSLTLFVNWRRIKIEAVLKSSGAARPLRWAVSLVGLTWDNWQLRGGDGSVVAHVDAPQGWDATGSQDDPNIAVTASYAGGFIRFDADLSAAVYPVTVDPTLTLQPDATDGLDNYFDQSQPTQNYGTGVGFNIGDSNASVSLNRGSIKFDLTSLDGTESIISTELTITLIQNGNYRASNNRTARLYRLKRAWIESQETWNIWSTGNNWQTAGGFGSDDCEQTEIGTCNFVTTDLAGDGKIFSITGANKSAIDLGNGWLIKVDTEVDDAYLFASSDHVTEANRPKLVINYTLAGQPMNARGVRVPGMRQWQPGRGPGF